MKKAIILLCLLFAVLLLNACQTTTTGLETPVISGKTPLRTSPVDVVSAYIAPQALVPQLSPIENGDLFDNIGFEIGLGAVKK